MLDLDFDGDVDGYLCVTDPFISRLDNSRIGYSCAHKQQFLAASSLLSLVNSALTMYGIITVTLPSDDDGT